MFSHQFFPQSFTVISLNLPLNFSRNVSPLYWIGMAMWVDVLYNNLRRWKVWSSNRNEWLVAVQKSIFFYFGTSFTINSAIT